MPETRYIEVYKNGKLIKREPYTVSDEELQEEVDQARLRVLADMPPKALKGHLLAEGFKLLCKSLGIMGSIDTEE